MLLQGGDMWTSFPEGPRPDAPTIDQLDFPATPTGMHILEPLFMLRRTSRMWLLFLAHSSHTWQRGPPDLLALQGPVD